MRAYSYSMKFLAVFAVVLSMTVLPVAYAETTVEVGNQISIAADVSNSLETDLQFAYITQIKNEDGMVVSLSWLTGSLAPRQSLSPAQSWTPPAPGNYFVEVYVWEDLNRPSALSPPLYMTIKAVSLSA